MDHGHQPPPDRGRTPAERIGEIRERFEWTRAAGIGPALSVLGDLAGRRVVELGCGGGHNLAHLVALHGAQGIGIDHDASKIKKARFAYGNVDGLAFIEAEASAYLHTQRTASIDICLSVFGAFSFSDPVPLTAEAARTLRPGGLLAVTFRETDTTDLVLILRRR